MLECGHHILVVLRQILADVARIRTDKTTVAVLMTLDRRDDIRLQRAKFIAPVQPLTPGQNVNLRPLCTLWMMPRNISVLMPS